MSTAVDEYALSNHFQNTRYCKLTSHCLLEALRLCRGLERLRFLNKLDHIRFFHPQSEVPSLDSIHQLRV
jgi:hypothetical protein